MFNVYFILIFTIYCISLTVTVSTLTFIFPHVSFVSTFCPLRCALHNIRRPHHHRCRGHVFNCYFCAFRLSHW